MPHSKGWNKSDIVDRCEGLRRHMEARGLATEDELDRWWPDDGRRAPKGDWIRCYAQYVRLNGRQEWTRPDGEEGERELLKALRGEPVEVELVDGDVVRCHPKSHDALRWFQARGWEIRWLRDRVAAFRDALDAGEVAREDAPEPLSALHAAEQTLARQLAVFCWAATHEGPALPWPYGEDPPDPPDRFLDLPPVDVYRINAAFLRANHRGAHLIDKLLGDEERSSFDVFFAQKARQMGRPSRDLMQREPMISQIVEAALSSPDPSELEG